MAMLRIIDPMYGDKRVEYSEDDKDSIEKAETLFDEKVKKKTNPWLAFKKLKDGTWKLIKKFDPKAAAIILAPPVAGG